MAYNVRLRRTDDGYIVWQVNGFVTAQEVLAAVDLIDKPGLGTWHYSLDISGDSGDNLVVVNRGIGGIVVKGT